MTLYSTIVGTYQLHFIIYVWNTWAALGRCDSTSIHEQFSLQLHCCKSAIRSSRAERLSLWRYHYDINTTTYNNTDVVLRLFGRRRFWKPAIRYQRSCVQRLISGVHVGRGAVRGNKNPNKFHTFQHFWT